MSCRKIHTSMGSLFHHHQRYTMRASPETLAQHAAGCRLHLSIGARRYRVTAFRVSCTLQDQKSTIQLGSSNLQISRLGIGTLQWGDPQQGFGARFREEELTDVFNTAVEGGINLFDTAEVYGYQGIKSGNQSEQILGRLAKASPERVVIGTKYFTVPWTNFLIGGGFRLGKKAVLDALKASLQRLGVQKVDLYQVHFLTPFFSQQVLADAFAEAVDTGLVEAVGVCNYGAEQLREFHALMAARGVPVASNQVKYNIFERKAEKSGLLGACKDLGVTLVAHSPLQRGLLTGRALEEGSEKLKKDELTVLKLLQFIGAVSGGKTVTQVALAYLMSKGAVPIPGAKSVAQVKEHLGAMSFNLDENEAAVIDERLDAF